MRAERWNALTPIDTRGSAMPTTASKSARDANAVIASVMTRHDVVDRSRMTEYGCSWILLKTHLSAVRVALIRSFVRVRRRLRREDRGVAAGPGICGRTAAVCRRA